MRNLVRNIGIIVMLMGVLMLILPALIEAQSNTSLACGFALVVAGFIGQIFLNKK